MVTACFISDHASLPVLYPLNLYPFSCKFLVPPKHFKLPAPLKICQERLFSLLIVPPCQLSTIPVCLPFVLSLCKTVMPLLKHLNSITSTDLLESCIEPSKPVPQLNQLYPHSLADSTTFIPLISATKRNPYIFVARGKKESS